MDRRQQTAPSQQHLLCGTHTESLVLIVRSLTVMVLEYKSYKFAKRKLSGLLALSLSL
uniref:Uncharacterized protein n=1 Tax=Anopheles arabiensis TaxID=7173 RepID=A0A182IFQ3_ANOAR